MDYDKVENTYIPVFKQVLGLVAGIGIGRMVGGATMNLAPQSTMFGKVAVGVAKVCVASAMTDVVMKHTYKDIDYISKSVKEAINSVSDKSEEN